MKNLFVLNEIINSEVSFPFNVRIKFVNLIKFGIPIIIIFLLLFSSLLFEGQSIQAGYQLRKAKNILKDLRSDRINLELTYSNLVNPIRIRELARERGFMPPERIFNLNSYIKQFETNNENDIP